MGRSTNEARQAMRALLARSGLSMRALSAAMGRDPGYVAAYLDPTRPSRARPTPDDLVAASDATGMSLVELLDAVWGIAPDRLASELGAPSVSGGLGTVLARLSPAERRSVTDFATWLADRGGGPARGFGHSSPMGRRHGRSS